MLVLSDTNRASYMSSSCDLVRAVDCCCRSVMGTRGDISRLKFTIQSLTFALEKEISRGLKTADLKYFSKRD